MNKRLFLGLGLISIQKLVWGCKVLPNSSSYRFINDAGVTFDWSHRSGELIGNLCAPTQGWIAAGFNDIASMNGTRFVMAHVAGEQILVEEHVAIDSTHKPVEALGLKPALTSAEGRFRNGQSSLRFSMTEEISERPLLRLSKGRSAYVMLAWSLEAGFDHHSAWRKHYATTL